MDYDNLYKILLTAEEIPSSFLQTDISQYDELQKCDIIEELYRFSENTDVQNFILNLFDDKNYLVRCEVYDFCSLIKNKNMLTKCIKKIAKEHSIIAKTYLLGAINDIIQEVGLDKEQYDYLYELSKSKKESSIRLQIQYNNIFFTVTNDIDYLYKILEVINSDDYHLRCVVINSLPTAVDNKQRNIIIKCLEERLNKEDSFAVKELIIDNLKMFE